MEAAQRSARITGVLFVITFVTSIAALPVPTRAERSEGYITGGGADSRICWPPSWNCCSSSRTSARRSCCSRSSGGRTNAWHSVTSRPASWKAPSSPLASSAVLAIVTLRQDAGAADAPRSTRRRSLVAIKDWTFLLGPGFIVGIGNGLMLGYLMYRSGLVPRRMAMLGLIGGPLICLSGIAVLFGVIDAGLPCRASRPSRSSSGSCRSASTSSSRASGRQHPSSPPRMGSPDHLTVHWSEAPYGRSRWSLGLVHRGAREAP